MRFVSSPAKRSRRRDDEQRRNPPRCRLRGDCRVEAIELPFRRFRQQSAASGEYTETQSSSGPSRGGGRCRGGGRRLHFGLYPSRRSPNSRLIGSRSTVVTTRLAPATNCLVSATRLPISVKVRWLKLRKPRLDVRQGALQLLVRIAEVLGDPVEIGDGRTQVRADPVRPVIAVLDAAEQLRGGRRRAVRIAGEFGEIVVARREPGGEAAQIFQALAERLAILLVEHRLTRSTVSFSFLSSSGPDSATLAKVEGADGITG